MIWESRLSTAQPLILSLSVVIRDTLNLTLNGCVAASVVMSPPRPPESRH